MSIIELLGGVEWAAAASFGLLFGFIFGLIIGRYSPEL